MNNKIEKAYHQAFAESVLQSQFLPLGDWSEDRVAGVEYVMSLLSDRERDYVMLRYGEGKTNQQVAFALRCTVSAATQRYYSILRKIDVLGLLPFIRYGKIGAENEYAEKRTIHPRNSEMSKAFGWNGSRTLNFLADHGIRTIDDFLDRGQMNDQYIISLPVSALQDIISSLRNCGYFTFDDGSRLDVLLVNKRGRDLDGRLTAAVKTAVNKGYSDAYILEMVQKAIDEAKAILNEDKP